jgi:thiamine-phosphate pyrophosphorylase
VEGGARKEGSLKIAGLDGLEGDALVPFHPAMSDTHVATRIFLVSPPRIDAATFAPRLEEALSAADVAAVLLAIEDASEQLLQPLVQITQLAGAAALITDDTRLAGHVKADGVHVGGGFENLRLAIESFKPKRIVGVGNVQSRHAALEAGELDVDYLFFGRPHGDTHDAPHPKALELAEWWSEMTEVPAVVMAGRAIDSVREAADTGAEFIALHDAVWAHPNGPGEAMRRAAAMLDRTGRRAA